MKKAVVEGLAGPEGKKTSQVGWEVVWQAYHSFLETYNLPKVFFQLHEEVDVRSCFHLLPSTYGVTLLLAI